MKRLSNGHRSSPNADGYGYTLLCSIPELCETDNSLDADGELFCCRLFIVLLIIANAYIFAGGPPEEVDYKNMQIHVIINCYLAIYIAFNTSSIIKSEYREVFCLIA